MASSIEFVEFVASRLEAFLGGDTGRCSMTMVYVNEKPIVLVCDDIA